MTAQIGERLIYEGRKVTMCTEPLNDFFALGGARPDFAANCTALWRGYVGTWEILDDRLYLVELAGTLEDGSAAALSTVFPGLPQRVFAHWYSGMLRVPEGRQLKYVHAGYGSRFERDRLIEFERGVVTRIRIRENGQSGNPDAPEGYGVGGFTVFPAQREAGEDR